MHMKFASATCDLLLVAVLLSSPQFCFSDDVEPEDDAKFNRYAGGYIPTTLVTDLAALDLDQSAFNEVLGDRKINEAMSIYTEGGHSGSYALLSITGLPSVSTQATNAATANSTNTTVATATKATTSISIPAGTLVRGDSKSNDTLVGTVKENVTLSPTGDNVIEVSYEIFARQEEYVGCQVGGLTAVQKANLDGCFAQNGTIVVELDELGEFEYEYDVRKNNKNTLTLQKLSTDAGSSMKLAGGAYIEEYQIYFDYYGDEDYANKWVEAAAYGNYTGFASERGDADFAKYDGRPARAEAMIRGSAYLIVWMEVVRLLHEAVEYCNGEKYADAVQSIDKAAVLYTGSLTAVRDGGDGVLLYELAELHADLAKPVGHTVDQNVSDASVNKKVIKELKAIQMAVTEEDKKCKAAETSRKRIVNLMKIPLVQGVVYYAYERETKAPTADDEGATMRYERLQSEGATFAASLLPWVYACDATAADTILGNMQLGAATNFQEVSDALNKTFDCMNISCVDVGGVWNERGDDYKEGAYPCGVSAKNRTGTGAGAGDGTGANSAGFSFRNLFTLCMSAIMAGILAM